MDRSSAIAFMKQKAGFRNQADFESKAVVALQLSQSILEAGGVMTEAGYSTEMPWFLKVVDQDLVIPAAANEVALPDDFLQEAEDEGPWYPNTVSTGEPPIYLEKAGSGAGRRTFTGTTSGPQVYEVRPETLFVYPAPDEELTLKWSYFAKDEVLSTNVENKWLKWVPSLLIGHAGQGLASDLRDMEASKEFSRMKIEGQKQLLTQNVAREMSNRRTSFGRYK